jgi:hypothetical protein
VRGALDWTESFTVGSVIAWKASLIKEGTTVNMISSESDFGASSWTISGGGATSNANVEQSPEGTKGFVVHHTGSLVPTSLESEVTNNLLSNPEFFSGWTTVDGCSVSENAILAPDGTLTGDLLLDTSGTAISYKKQDITVVNDSDMHTVSVYMHEDTANVSGATLNLFGGTTAVNINANVTWSTHTTDVGTLVEVHSGWWLLTFNIINNSTGNTTLRMQVAPDTENVGSQKSAYFWGAYMVKCDVLDTYKVNNGMFGWDTFDIFVPNPIALSRYEAYPINIGFDDIVRISGAILSALGPLEVGIASPLLEIDYRIEADEYDGFESWSIGNASCKYIKHKLVSDNTNGVSYISSFLPTADLLEHTTNEQFTIASGGTTITFTQPFHLPPIFGTATIVSVASGTPAYATITDITATQALVHVYNLSGTSAGGEAVISLTGV